MEGWPRTRGRNGERPFANADRAPGWKKQSKPKQKGALQVRKGARLGRARELVLAEFGVHEVVLVAEPQLQRGSRTERTSARVEGRSGDLGLKVCATVGARVELEQRLYQPAGRALLARARPLRVVAATREQSVSSARAGGLRRYVTHAAVVCSMDHVARPSSSRSSGQSSASALGASAAVVPFSAAFPAAAADELALAPRGGIAASPRLNAEIFEPHTGLWQSFSMSDMASPTRCVLSAG